MRPYNKMDTMRSVALLLGLGIGAFVLFLLAARLNGPAEREAKRKRKPLLCVVCEKQPATHQSNARYTLKRNNRQPDPHAHPAWLCDHCPEPEKISGHCLLRGGAYTSPKYRSEGTLLGMIKFIVFISGVVCIVIMFRLGYSMLNLVQVEANPKAETRLSIMAISSFVLSLSPFGCFPGFILGTIALHRLGYIELRLRGIRFAIAGTVISLFWLIVISCFILELAKT